MSNVSDFGYVSKEAAVVGGQVLSPFLCGQSANPSVSALTELVRVIGSSNLQQWVLLLGHAVGVASRTMRRSCGSVAHTKGDVEELEEGTLDSCWAVIRSEYARTASILVIDAVW